MSIPTELPSRQLPSQQYTDQFLSNLRPGEVLSARVTGQAASGATLLSIAGRQIAVQMQIAPVIGSLLTLEVSPHQSGQQGIQFNILSQQLPLRSAETSQLAQANQAASQAGQTAAASQPAASTNTAAQSGGASAPASSNAPAAAQGAAASSVASSGASAAASSIPALRVVPSTPGAPAVIPSLQAGTQVQAMVVARPAPNLALISVQGKTALVTAPPQLAVGTQLGLQVQQSGTNMQFAVQSLQLPAVSAANGGTTGAPSSGASPSAPAPAPTTYAPPSPVAQAVAPLTAAMRSSIATQNSLQPLFQTISSLGAKVEALPQPVQDAISRVLQSIPNMRETEQFTGAVLKEAISKSGLQMEAVLSRAIPGQPELQNDVKALLLLLRGSLRQWLGDVPLPPLTSRAAPPLKGQMPRANTPSLPALANDADLETIGKTILGQTESALSRVRVMQLNALQDASQPQTHQTGRTEMQFEIPFVFAGQMTLVHLQVQGDASGQVEAELRRWKMRFALTLDAFGEVGGEVGLDGGAVNVSLWAIDDTSADVLRAHIDELVTSLEALGLNTGIVKVRERPPHTPPPPNGTHLVDAIT